MPLPLRILGPIVLAVALIASALSPALPHGQSPVAPDTTGPDLDITRVERMVHDRVNQIRSDQGLSRLQYSDSLRPLAEMHSRDMAARNFFGHDNPDGASVNDRARSIGLSCDKQIDERTTAHGFGENLFKGTLYREYREIYEDGRMVRREYDWMNASSLAEAIVDGWMDSPGHRANLLEPRYDGEAIAVATDGTRFYVTQIFC